MEFKDKIYCPECNSYFKEEDLRKKKTSKTVSGVNACDSHGNNKYADVIYYFSITCCPKCGHEFSKSLCEMEEKNYRE